MPQFGNNVGYISAAANFPDTVMEANVFKLAAGLFTVAVESIRCALWLSQVVMALCLHVIYNMVDPVGFSDVCNH